MPGRVGILVFTCNRPDDLKRCLDSIKAQTHTSWELLVVDNGTDPATDALLASCGCRVIKDGTKKLSYLFNLGWKHLHTDLIAYLADDVKIEPDWLAEGLASLERRPEAAVVTGPLVSPAAFTGQMHALHERSRKNPILRLAADFYETVVLENKTFEPCVLCESGGYSLGQGFRPSFSQEREVDLATTSGMIIRRCALEEVGGFDESFLFNHADGDLFVRLRKTGARIIYCPRMLAFHYNRMGPSRYPFIVGRDTAYFLLKDIRPRSLNGWFGLLVNCVFINAFWLYRSLAEKDPRQLKGITGFGKGILDYLLRGG